VIKGRDYLKSPLYAFKAWCLGTETTLPLRGKRHLNVQLLPTFLSGICMHCFCTCLQFSLRFSFLVPHHFRFYFLLYWGALNNVI